MKSLTALALHLFAAALMVGQCSFSQIQTVQNGPAGVAFANARQVINDNFSYLDAQLLLKLADPTTVSGDLIFRSDSGPDRLPIGADGKILGIVGGLPTWVTAPTGGSAGVADPGANGVMKRTSLNTTAPSVFGDIVALFGSGSCSGYLKSDGTCSTPGGGGGGNFDEMVRWTYGPQASTLNVTDAAPEGAILGTAGTLAKCYAVASTAGTGGTTTFDVLKNGVSVFSVGKLTLADGATSGSITVFSTTAFAEGDRISTAVSTISPTTKPAGVSLACKISH
jgi:hypothetical protein